MLVWNNKMMSVDLVIDRRNTWFLQEGPILSACLSSLGSELVLVVTDPEETTHQLVTVSVCPFHLENCTCIKLLLIDYTRPMLPKNFVVSLLTNF